MLDELKRLKRDLGAAEVEKAKLNGQISALEEAVALKEDEAGDLERQLASQAEDVERRRRGEEEQRVAKEEEVIRLAAEGRGLRERAAATEAELEAARARVIETAKRTIRRMLRASLFKVRAVDSPPPAASHFLRLVASLRKCLTAPVSQERRSGRECRTTRRGYEGRLIRGSPHTMQGMAVSDATFSGCPPRRPGRASPQRARSLRKGAAP